MLLGDKKANEISSAAEKSWEYTEEMRYRILLVAVLLATTLMQAQRGGTRSAGGAGGATTTPGIGGVGIPSASTPEGTTRSKDLELRINEKLTAKLKTLLPQGSDPQYLSKGFTELKDFVTAIRASNNLSVPFPELKHKMIDGSTKALQKAIQELKPDVDAKAETKKAGEQAKQDIKESKS